MIANKLKAHKNGKLKRGTKAQNSYPSAPASPGYPLSGVFDMFGFGQSSAASQPWEMSNSNSYNLISLQRIMLSYAYVLHGPIRTLVDQPVYDAFRGGFKVKTDEVSAEEIEDMHREIKRLKLTRKMIEALRWDRLFGGAGIIINVDEDYQKPFKVENIKESSKIEFKVADRWELAWNGTPGDPRTPFTYYGIKLDPSRVIKIIGEEPPSLIKQRLQGWGMSVVECVIREINMYFKNNNVIFELLDEAKVDIWKIKGFNAQVLSQLGQGKTAKRIQIATRMKDFLNAITLDSEDDYEQKQITFTGLSEMLEQIRIGIAAAIRMPMAKIFGLASKGFASGEDDLENYAAIVDGQRDRCIDVLDSVMPILCMKLWGFVPDDLAYEFMPLRTLTAEQEQNVLNAKFTRHSTLYTQGIYNPQEYCEALKTDKLLLIETAVAKGAEPEPPLNMGMDQSLDDAGEPKPSAGKKPMKEKE